MTSLKNRNRLTTIILILFTIQCIFFIVLLFQIRAVNQKIFNTNRLVIEKLINTEKEEFNIEVNPNDIVLGDKNAPLTLTMFSNYNCSACKAFFNETFPEIEKQFITTGKIKFVVKLVVPKKSVVVNYISRSAICAFQQNKFIELNKFLTQSDMMPDSGQLANYVSQQLHLDINSFDKCLNDTGIKESINENNRIFRKNRIKGTPAFIINDSLFLGSKSFRKFEEIINHELTGTK